MNMIMIRTQDKHSLKGTEIIVYMDNILIATKEGATINEHRVATFDILQVLQDHDLFLKLEKCVWESPHIDYLGLILEKGVTSMEPAKVEGVKSWPTPSMVKQVCSFLGFCNFYHAFIHGFSHLAKPLNELTKKDHPWTWEQLQQDAFDTLKSCITAQPVLIQPHLDQPFKLEVDSSGFTQGAVLMQKGEDGKRHPIGFYSKTLTKPERNYNIKDLEFSAMVNTLLNWRALLAGSPHEIIVHTDHVNLQYWTQPHKISHRVACLMQALEEFPIRIQHIPGRTNTCADALSRCPDYDQGEKDNENIIVLPERLFIKAALIEQDSNILCLWINAHNLTKHEGRWWKDNRKVITGDLPIH